MPTTAWGNLNELCVSQEAKTGKRKKHGCHFTSPGAGHHAAHMPTEGSLVVEALVRKTRMIILYNTHYITRGRTLFTRPPHNEIISATSKTQSKMQKNKGMHQIKDAQFFFCLRPNRGMSYCCNDHVLVERFSWPFEEHIQYHQTVYANGTSFNVAEYRLTTIVKAKFTAMYIHSKASLNRELYTNDNVVSCQFSKTIT